MLSTFRTITRMRDIGAPDKPCGGAVQEEKNRIINSITKKCFIYNYLLIVNKFGDKDSDSI